MELKLIKILNFKLLLKNIKLLVLRHLLIWMKKIYLNNFFKEFFKGLKV